MTLSFLRSLDLPQSPSLQAEKVSRVVTSFGLERREGGRDILPFASGEPGARTF